MSPSDVTTPPAAPPTGEANDPKPSRPDRKASDSKLSQYAKVTPEQLGFWGKLWHWMTGLVLKPWFATQYKITILGKERLPKKEAGSLIIAANHSSMLDIPLLSQITNYRPISYLAKEELFKHPIAAFYFKACCVIAINRFKPDIASFRSCKTVLSNKDWWLAIFPEGTRNKEGKIGESKKGVAFIAKSNKVPILPVSISRYGEKQNELIVHVGTLIPYQEDKDAETLAKEVTEAIRELKDGSDRHYEQNR